MTKSILKLKDPGSAITHFIGLVAILLFSPALLVKASYNSGSIHIFSMIIFVITITLLYSASTIYHSLDISEETNVKLRKFDHMAIYTLIAGSYTPICLIAIKNHGGVKLLTIIWMMAFIGIAIKAFWMNSPKWLSSVIYIIMGWTCVLAFSPLVKNLDPAAFNWLLAGGIIYTVGGIIYALKLPIFNKRFPYFGSHEIFHIFVMGGSLCHFVLMYKFISTMPIL